MNREKSATIIFLVGLVAILSFVALSIARFLSANPELLVFWPFAAVTAAALLALAYLIVRSRSTARWWAMFLASGLIIALSLPSPFSWGLILFPFGFALVMVSGWRLKRSVLQPVVDDETRD